MNCTDVCCCAVGTYADLHTAIRERDLAVLAVHGRKEWNPAAPATLLPAGSYSEQEVAATAARLHEKVTGAGQGVIHTLVCSGYIQWLRQCPASKNALAMIGAAQMHSSLVIQACVGCGKSRSWPSAHIQHVSQAA